MIKTLSSQYCISKKVLILENKAELVKIGYVNRLASCDTERLARYFEPEKRVDYQNISNEQFDILIARQLSGIEEKTVTDKVVSKDDVINAAEATPVVNLFNSIISEAIMNKASDIHIEIGERETKIKSRIEGKIREILVTDIETGNALTGRIKLLANLNILEHRKCQDGRFDYKKNNYIYDIRVSVMPGIEGESTVLRLLGGDNKAPDLEELGFTSEQLSLIKEMISLEYGLILVAGPTGSGKTTTLASILTRIKQKDLNIITVEDPVEYRISDTLQISINDEIGQSFSEILKRVLRHDPDVLMIGEIRDEDTAAMACRMALTGHLVFASIHTNNCDETPLRLVDMGVPKYIVQTVVKGIISQRLISKEEGGRTVSAEVRYFTEEREVRDLCIR